MAAAATDYFVEAGDPGSATTLAAPGYTIGDTSITVVSTTNWPTATGVVFSIDVIGADGLRVDGTYNVYQGTVATATSITNVSHISGTGTNRNYSAGTTTRVYIVVASEVTNRLVAGLLTEHTQTGTHGAVTATSVTVATGKITTTAVGKLEDRSIPLDTYRAATVFDHVVSGGVWTGDSYGGSLNASMTAITVMINGQLLNSTNSPGLAAITARAFTTNVDTYIDVLNTAGVGTLVYTTAATNAASPALAANSIRIGIIQAAATITAATKVNQGQEDRVFPIASSIPYAVTDSLGNLICPRDPNRKVLGYRQIISNVSNATTTQVIITSCPVIVPTGRKVSISGMIGSSSNPAISSVFHTLWEGAVVAGTQLQRTYNLHAIAGNSVSVSINAVRTPASSSVTYTLGFAPDTNTETTNASSTIPTFIKVELV